MIRYFKIYDMLFDDICPELFDHFKKQNLSPHLYLLEWFMTLFSKTLPIQLTSRIWDNFILEGESYLYRSALGILKFCMPQLLQADFDDIVYILHHLPKDIDEQKLFEVMESFKIPQRYEHVLSKLNPRATGTIKSKKGKSISAGSNEITFDDNDTDFV